MALKISQLAEKLGLAFEGEASVVLDGAKPLAEAGPTHLAFCDNPRYVAQLAETKAAAVIVSAENADKVPTGSVALVSHEVYADWARALALLYPRVQPKEGMSEFACIGEDVVMGKNCSIGPHVSLQHCTIGDNVVIHANVSIGQDGFGFAPSKTGIVKVPQVGRVVIGNHVEIGAGTTIDRGALGDTVIGDHCKIDNLVQIAHNVRLGTGCMVAAQAGISGSTVLGNYVIVGGKAGLAGHIEIADGVTIAGRSGVTKSITEKGITVGGFPAVPIEQWRRREAVIAKMSKKK